MYQNEFSDATRAKLIAIMRHFCVNIEPFSSVELRNEGGLHFRSSRRPLSTFVCSRTTYLSMLSSVVANAASQVNVNVVWHNVATGKIHTQSTARYITSHKKEEQ